MSIITPIWFDEKFKTVKVIDQRFLPHELIIKDLQTVDDAIFAIQNMIVRGAPLIGVTGAFGVYLALKNFKNYANFILDCDKLKSARPTAVNLKWAIEQVLNNLCLDNKSFQDNFSLEILLNKSLQEAQKIRNLEINNCKKIGKNGFEIIKEISKKKQNKTVNILTHCNAGWLACIEYGTATAPIYKAFEMGLDIFVWVDETRPLNQGARLTAWELKEKAIKHAIIADNTGGYLMQNNLVDLVIVGADRVALNGDTANKIGTYLKALAAKDNNIPFYVALPTTTIDFETQTGSDIKIEKRDSNEIRFVEGLDKQDGKIKKILICPESSDCVNFAFDITPNSLITGFITEKKILKAYEIAENK